MRKPKNVLPEDRESENILPKDLLKKLKDESAVAPEGLTYKSEFSEECQRYIDAIYRSLRWYIDFYLGYARRFYRRWQTANRELNRVRSELEECRRDQETVPPCVRANIDYENVFGQHTKLSDVIDTLEEVVEGIRELEPANKAQDFSDTLYDKLHSISDVASILEDAYRKFPGI